MKVSRTWLLIFFSAIWLLLAGTAQAENIRATLTGFEEVPVVSTVAHGEFRGTINRGDQSIDFELRYSGLQGNVQQGHIHVAQPSVNGLIVIWLCQTATRTDPTGLAATCQTGQDTEAVITGTITAANVVGPADPTNNPQQLDTGDLAEVIRAIRAGAAYVNVHTNLSPGGEIRGQIRARR
jgi:hypothetical protein